MNKTIARVPIEDEEMMDFHDWLDGQQIPHEHVPNEIGGSTPALKARARKMHKMGTTAGFPDMLIFVPVENIDGEVDAYQPIVVEMKRKKYSTTSAEQKRWLAIIEKAGIPCAVCKGAAAAIEYVTKVMEEIRQ